MASPILPAWQARTHCLQQRHGFVKRAKRAWKIPFANCVRIRVAFSRRPMWANGCILYVPSMSLVWLSGRLTNWAVWRYLRCRIASGEPRVAVCARTIGLHAQGCALVVMQGCAELTSMLHGKNTFNCHSFVSQPIYGTWYSCDKLNSEATFEHIDTFLVKHLRWYLIVSTGFGVIVTIASISFHYFIVSIAIVWAEHCVKIIVSLTIISVTYDSVLMLLIIVVSVVALMQQCVTSIF